MTIEISFIIPSYNEAKYIGNCLKSILCQEVSHNLFELIVVDNESSDCTTEIATSFGAHVLINKKRGAASSRNMGALYAKGRFIAFIDADCILDSLWLAHMLKHISSPCVVASAARATPITEGMTWVEKGWANIFVCKSSCQKREFTSVTSLGSSNMLIKKNIFEVVGGFDESLLSCEDYDLSQRLIKIGTLLIDEQIKVTHLRESKTLLELFDREVARGTYSLRCFIKNEFSLIELPSIAVPFICITLIIAFVVFFTMEEYLFSFVLFLCLISIPLLYLIRSGLKYESIDISFKEYLIATTYVVARSFALLSELLVLLSSGKYRS